MSEAAKQIVSLFVSGKPEDARPVFTQELTARSHDLVASLKKDVHSFSKTESVEQA